MSQWKEPLLLIRKCSLQVKVHMSKTLQAKKVHFKVLQCIKRKLTSHFQTKLLSTGPPEPIMKPVWGNIILMRNSAWLYQNDWILPVKISLNNIKCHRIFENNHSFKESFLERFFWEHKMILSLLHPLFLSDYSVRWKMRFKNPFVRTNKINDIVCKLYGLCLQSFFKHDHFEPLRKKRVAWC